MQNLDGLSAGFLAGFNTMNNYYRGKKEDERADKMMGLRDAQWQNELERQKVSDQRYSDETAYAKGRDSLADARYQGEFAYRKERDEVSDKQQNFQNGIASANLGLAQAQNSRAQKMHDLQIKAQEKADWLSDNMPAINVAVNKYGSGQQLTMQEQALLNNPYAARYNPTKIFTPEFTNASRSALGKVREIVGNPEAKSWNQQQLYDAINTPEMTKSLGVMFKNDLEDGVGQRTADGSVVSGYSSPRIVPTGNGMFAVEADVTYEGPDGKRFTKPAPITVGRGTGGDAEVKQFSANDLIRYFGNAAKASTEASSQQFKDWSVAAGLSEGADNKGYRQAVVKQMADSNKNIDRINNDQVMSEQEKAAAVQRERDALQQQIGGLAGVYGVSQGKKSPSSASDWAMGDAAREEFVRSNPDLAQEALRSGMLDELYQRQIDAGWRPGRNGEYSGGDSKPSASNGGSKVTPPPRKRSFKLNMPSGYEQYSSPQGESQAPDRTFMDDLADARSGLVALGGSVKATPNPANYSGLSWAARPTK